MKTAPTGLLPGSDPETEALIKEARRRQRRRYLVTGLAVVVLAGAAGVMVSQIGPSGHPPGRQGPRHPAAQRGKGPPFPTRAAVPRFFADTVTAAEGNGPLQVRASASGRLVAEQATPGPGGVVAGLAATGAGSFVIAEPVNGGCGTRLYRFQLTGRGSLGRLAPVGPELTGWVSSLAASAGGQVIGYAVSGCGKGSPGHIGVFNARTGRSREWSDVNVGGNPGNVALGGAVSLSANGRLLAFTGWDVAGNWHVVGGGRFTRQVVRVLPTNAPAGTVAQRSRVVLSRPLSQPELAAVALSPNAESFYLCMMSSSRDRSVRKIAAYATATGGRQQAIATLTGTSIPATCQMALDSAGRFLLLTNSLSNPRYPGTPVLRLARIDLTARSAVILSIKLPSNAGMDPYAGMTSAW
jgi:hypothetical protein